MSEITEVAWLFLQIEEEVLQDQSINGSNFVDEVCKRYANEFNVSIEKARRLRNEAFGEPEADENLPF